MRDFRPSLGNNVSGLKRFFGRFPMNGSSSPSAWTQGGQGMGVPVHTGTGVFTVTFTDPPGGTLVGWNMSSRADAIANIMAIYPLTWNASTNTLTITTAVPTSPLTAADPPAAATDREFAIELYFSMTGNR